MAWDKGNSWRRKRENWQNQVIVDIDNPLPGAIKDALRTGCGVHVHVSRKGDDLYVGNMPYHVFVDMVVTRFKESTLLPKDKDDMRASKAIPLAWVEPEDDAALLLTVRETMKIAPFIVWNLYFAFIVKPQNKKSRWLWALMFDHRIRLAWSWLPREESIETLRDAVEMRSEQHDWLWIIDEFDNDDDWWYDKACVELLYKFWDSPDDESYILRKVAVFSDHSREDNAARVFKQKWVRALCVKDTDEGLAAVKKNKDVEKHFLDTQKRWHDARKEHIKNNAYFREYRKKKRQRHHETLLLLSEKEKEMETDNG